MDGRSESQSSASYGALLDRLRSLETSHEKLKGQFDMLLQEKGSVSSTNNNNIQDSFAAVGMEDPGEEEGDPSWYYIPGRFFSGSPYRKVLECMGHAVHISRPGSGEITYWNQSAEKLYGYQGHEALGQADEALLIDKKHHALARRITESLNDGQIWSGQLPCKKRSGQIFMAIMTKSVLCEDGEFVGVITVSSDAALFNDLCRESEGVDQDHADGKRSGQGIPINLRKFQWRAQSPPIASSVSNLASKVLLRKDGDDGWHAFSNTKVKDQNESDVADVKYERPPRAPETRQRPKNTFAREGYQNEESTSDESSPPLKFANKVLAKLHIGVSGNLNYDKDAAIQENNFDDPPFGKQVLVKPFPQETKQATTSNDYILDEARPVNACNKDDNEFNAVEHCEINWKDLQLFEEVGQGSFAIVYRGIWNGSDVAIKVYLGDEYNEDTLLGYSKELDIMRRLRHPNVLLFMGAVCSHEKLALVTEFLPRGSLHKALHKNNLRLHIRRRLRMALDVARGMNYLHRRNPPIVHRDLKSSNLLVDKSWTVKVGDFGLSKLKDATFLTSKSGRGTPQWMAPEVLRNEPSTEKSDIFSFGVILWELVTESIPWGDLNFLQDIGIYIGCGVPSTHSKVVGVVGFMNRRLDLPENLDPKVSSIIYDCWQSEPENRPSFEDIIRRMTELIHTVSAGNTREESRS